MKELDIEVSAHKAELMDGDTVIARWFPLTGLEYYTGEPESRLGTARAMAIVWSNLYMEGTADEA